MVTLMTKASEPANWGLFYRHVNGRPDEFREVRRVGNSVWVRRGKVKTWGTCEITNYENLEDAQVGFTAALRTQNSSGYVLTRQGFYDPASFDFDQLRTEIREGARQAFTACRAAHPDENINAFALISDDSAMTILPVANSEEARQKKGAEEDFLWNAAEWSYQDGDEFLDVAYRMILPRCQDVPFEIEFQDFRRDFIESCVKALEDLDHEGFFGTGVKRENVVVLFQIPDSNYIDDAIRRLNTPAMYNRFRTWFKSWN